MNPARPRHFVVVVLGDLGRSPRSVYHAQALAEEGCSVDLVGYAETPLSGDAPGVRIRGLRDPRWLRPRTGSWSVYLPRAALRAVVQAVQLGSLLLFRTYRPDTILVQNPPSFPTLPLAWLAAKLRGARLVIDWHNLGYAALRGRLGGPHPLVRLSSLLEGGLGRRATAHLVVSEALRVELQRAWGLPSTVLRDHPAAHFLPATGETRAKFRALHAELIDPKRPTPGRRSAVVVSPTSWTADEDFDLLLAAAAEYDRKAAADATLPALVVVVTGRGPLRAGFEARAAALPLENVTLRTAWLEPDEYPLMLACADLGVSLHRSSSGVDLPMKVADMMGVGLPVCVLDYAPCIREIMEPGVHGVLFRSAEELATAWADLLGGDETGALAGMRAQLAGRRGPCWRDGWRSAALPVLEGRGA